MPKTDKPAGPLSLPAILAFATAYMPFAALQLSVAVQLPRFFATTLGVGAAAGAIFGAVRLIDIPVDPALGLGMDRTKTPIGRYRPWLILAAPVLMLALYMTFQAPPGVSTTYLGFWLLILYLGMSMLLVGGNAWAASLATTYNARSRIFGAQSGMGVLGAAAVLAIPIFTDTRHMSEGDSVRWVGWFLMGLAPLAILVTLSRTPERIAADHSAHFRLADYAALLARPNVLRLVAADFLITLGPGWMSALYLFFFEDSRGFSLAQSNILLAIYILAGLVGAPATAWLANKISKHRALMVNTTGYSLMLVLIFSLPRGNFALTAPGMFVAGAFAAGFVVAIRSITADIGDEIRLEKGRQLIGLLYALTSGTTKAASALAVFLTITVVLARAGYDFRPGAHNGPDQVRALELAYVIGPIIFVMLAGACFIGYRLTAARHADIRRQLEARDGIVDPAAALESLSGETDLVTAGHAP